MARSIPTNGRGLRVAFAVTLLAACTGSDRSDMSADDAGADRREDPIDSASNAESPADAGADSQVGARDAETPPDAEGRPDAPALPDASSDGAAGAVSPEPDAGDAGAGARCDRVIELRAHGGQTLDDTSPFMAPARGDSYELFYFAPSWSSTMHVIGVEPLVDNAIVRDWMLYMKESGLEMPGSHRANVGRSNPPGTPLGAWSPGAGSMPIPSDVGLKVVQGAQARFELEVHYFASSDSEDRADRSGVRLCLSNALRPKEAGLHALGAFIIISDGKGGTVEASGRCTPRQDSHLLAYAPNMRRQGRRLRIVARHNALDSVLIDRPFDPSAPGFVTLPESISTRAGELLTTTCSYAADRPFVFGPFEGDEVCYALVLAWPAGSLSNGMSNGFYGDSSCIDDHI